MFIELGKRESNLSGMRFERLFAVGPVEKRTNGHVVYLCQCDCGTMTRVTNSNLKSGHSRSCGCLMRERLGNATRTHGLSHTLVYGVWCQMIQRCHLPTAPNYKFYGERGISVCSEWRSSFEAFVRDMGERPYGHEIDRIDSSGDYEPDNCRWVPKQDQTRNTRRNVWIELHGRKALLTDLERAIGSKDRIGKRLRSGRDASDLIKQAMENLNA